MDKNNLKHFTTEELLNMREEWQETISNINEVLEAKQKSDWRYTQDILHLQDSIFFDTVLTVSSEYSDWLDTKETIKSNLSNNDAVFNFQINGDESVGISIENAKKLVKYLQEKIDFMEEE